MIEIIRSIIERFHSRKYQFVENIGGRQSGVNKRCLLYYKTDSFYRFKFVSDYKHTNFWEIREIVSVLNQHGFIVDIVDRSNENFIPEDKYDLFIGLGAGNSGKYFAKYATRLQKAVKVLYAAGPEPELSNKLVKNRYNQFIVRTGVNAPYQRIITEVNFSEFIVHTDYIIVIGEENSFSYNSYLQFGKPVFTLRPSSSPKLKFNNQWLKTRSMNTYLCFAGNGLICKGVDLLIEAFTRLPKCTLYICGPKELHLFKAYKQLPSNIIYKGFIKVGGSQFNKLSKKCGFVILHSASEGCATSVTTCLRNGLVPIVNREVGLNVNNYGYLLDKKDPSEYIDDIVETVKKTSLLTRKEYNSRVSATLQYSRNFTQTLFSQTFNDIISKIRQKEHL